MPRRYVRIPPEDRLFSKMLMGDGCWPFTGYVGPRGYGSLGMPNGVPQPAHRVAYESWVGPIPDGMGLDHLCRNRACVRPDHLEPVTSAENTRRGAMARFGGRCKRGHEHPVGERCRKCAAIQWASWYSKHPDYQKRS